MLYNTKFPIVLCLVNVFRALPNEILWEIFIHPERTDTSGTLTFCISSSPWV